MTTRLGFFRHFSLKLLGSIILSLSFMTSCVTAPSYEGTETSLTSYPYGNQKPRLWVTYYPAFSPLTYPSDEAVMQAKPSRLADVRPYRDHRGVWTDDVMRYDLDGMQASNFSAAVLMVKPQELLDPNKVSRIKRFFTLASTYRPRFSIGLGIYSDKRLAMGSGNFSRFLEQSGFKGLKGLLTLQPHGERLLVIFDSNSIKLHQQQFSEEAFFDIRELNSLKRAGMALVRCGDSGHSSRIDWISQRSWPQPRGNGSFFQEMLNRAFSRKQAIICVHSWNNLRDGSFLIGNSFDQELMLTTLRQAVDHLEQLRLK